MALKARERSGPINRAPMGSEAHSSLRPLSDVRAGCPTGFRESTDCRCWVRNFDFKEEDHDRF